MSLHRRLADILASFCFIVMHKAKKKNLLHHKKNLLKYMPSKLAEMVTIISKLWVHLSHAVVIFMNKYTHSEAVSEKWLWV